METLFNDFPKVHAKGQLPLCCFLLPNIQSNTTEVSLWRKKTGRENQDPVPMHCSESIIIEVERGAGWVMKQWVPGYKCY